MAFKSWNRVGQNLFHTHPRYGMSMPKCLLLGVVRFSMFDERNACLHEDLHLSGRCSLELRQMNALAACSTYVLDVCEYTWQHCISLDMIGCLGGSAACTAQIMSLYSC